MSSAHEYEAGAGKTPPEPPSRDEAFGPEVEAYEDEGSMILFESANPLAWVEAAQTVSLDDVA
ncbi:MAG: hypothetical protein A07HR60_01708 [uncultured archaeon A07HR60]|jgi:hypothetical protein|nr:MAG: hypothetical protein A07HR60_01708 [uncultured archaeon A07HR60]